ncbi:MAG: hypothetical protein M3081_17405 [Gemmatimonadota bacterium]|nr:hypothetical protein [Gemmatimonadota bacterium]
MELAFAMIIIGILTAVGYWRISNEKQKATRAKLIESLDHLMITEEAYFAQADSYTTDLALMQYRTLDYISIVISNVTQDGWTARAYEPTYGNACYISYGRAALIAGKTFVTNKPECYIE